MEDLKINRITVFSIGYGFKFPKYRHSYASSGALSGGYIPLEAPLALDSGKVSPPDGGTETVLGYVSMQTPCERERRTHPNPLNRKDRPSDCPSVIGRNTPQDATGTRRRPLQFPVHSEVPGYGVGDHPAVLNGSSLMGPNPCLCGPCFSDHR